jgi:hypothetical protein
MDTHLPRGICNFKEMSGNIFSFNQAEFLTTIYPRHGLFYEGGGSYSITKVWETKASYAYPSKGLSPIQKCFHPMEGECYALVWGIMHFWQYRH